MTNPLDDEVYGDRRTENENASLNGNPGKPQSDYQLGDEDQPEPDPSDFGDDAGEVVPGTVAPTDKS